MDILDLAVLAVIQDFQELVVTLENQGIVVLAFLDLADILDIQAHKAHPLLLKGLLPLLLYCHLQAIKLMMPT